MLLMSDSSILDGYHQLLLMVSEVSAMDIGNEFPPTDNQSFLAEPFSTESVLSVVLSQHRAQGIRHHSRSHPVLHSGKYCRRCGILCAWGGLSRSFIFGYLF